MTEGRLTLVDYNPQWLTIFQQEGKLIQAILKQETVQIHHIGSTAVPGLIAKPIIDILVEVHQMGELDKYINKLALAGYQSQGEFGIPGRHFFSKGAPERTHHLHAYAAGSPDVQRHTALRDYLIAHPAIAEEYGKLKLMLARTTGGELDWYQKGKNDFLKDCQEKAIHWSRAQEND
jgi:GrpB-like predicted nucleotidyltransferase (UPF0157 family)